MDRRGFLKGALSAGAAFAAVPLLAQTGRKYRTVLVGSGWWGRNILQMALQTGTVTVAALCDVDDRERERATAMVTKFTSDTPKQYRDFRECLEREKPEIVINATPDHWHALITIAAVRAGAHVYVEKPICHTIDEGKAMVRAARDTGRVVQVGTHRRVSPHHLSAMAFLRSGKAGKIGMVRAFLHNAGGEGAPTPDMPTPAGLDWDMWCGPAPLRPFNRRMHPRGWRSFLDYANGPLGDWGIHWMDQILWWTEEKYPRRVYSTGGRFINRDNSDAPDTQVATYEFETFTALWEHRDYSGDGAEKHSVGTYFHGTEGTLHLGFRDGWTFYPRSDRQPTAHEDARLEEPDGQNIRELWLDFVRAIETKSRPVSDIETGHRATTMSLLGMLSLKLGRSVAWDGAKETIPGDPEAVRLMSRAYRGPWEYPKG